MGLTDEYERKRHQRAYGEGVARAKRVKAGKEAPDLFRPIRETVGTLIPADSEYASRQHGYDDEMRRQGSHGKRVANSDTSRSSSSDSYSLGLSTPERSSGCVFIGLFLVVMFGIPFIWVAGQSASFRGGTSPFEWTVCGISFVAGGTAMVVLGLIPHGAGLGYMLFFALILTLAPFNVMVALLTDLRQPHPAMPPDAALGSSAVMLIIFSLGFLLLRQVVKDVTADLRTPASH